MHKFLAATGQGGNLRASFSIVLNGGRFFEVSIGGSLIRDDGFSGSFITFVDDYLLFVYYIRG